MSSHSIALIHATPLAMPPVSEAFARELPEVRLLHLLDEGLLAVLEPGGAIGPRAVDRMTRVIGLARDSGAALIQLTCSAYSPLIATLRLLAPVPVLAIDDVLVETAVRRERRIGLISTQTLTERALRAAADRAGVELDLAAIVFRTAFEALARGDFDGHDRLLAEQIRAMGDRDVIVLGQASMARVIPTLPEDLAARVLTSPGLAVAEARRVLGS
ncbi:MAG TPA: aspartate/glutamate racemase family protein [Chloroflexota bacterium]|nr:aspartate/glutamate racemase family protein [Chloroflexota bacterium]